MKKIKITAAGCMCANGVPVVDAACITPATEQCESCYAGFVLENYACIAEGGGIEREDRKEKGKKRRNNFSAWKIVASS